MWVMYGFLSAFFAGITSILAKCGIKKTDSDIATAIRTIIVVIFSWIMVIITGQFNEITDIGGKSWIFLTMSGMSTGASWLFYFKALQIGDINKVVPIDKSSTILTIILAFIFLGEKISILKSVAVIIIAAGTYLMIQKKENSNTDNVKNRKWFIYACLSAVFASLTSILGKVGMEEISSNLGTAVRTVVVLVMSWVVVIIKGNIRDVKKISFYEKKYICLSGIATGTSWLCYYKALKDGLASVVVPIDKLSILVTIIFSYIVFKEKLSKKAVIGLILNVTGTMLMII